MCHEAQPEQQEQPDCEILKSFSKWTQDASNHILLVHLPGFNKEDIKIKVQCSGKIIVACTKEATEHRHICVEETFTAPKTSNIMKICAKFDNGLLRLFVPKAIPDDKKEKKIRCHKEMEVPVCKQQSFLDSINKHERMMALAMAAISVGFLLGFYTSHI